jgi:hypothetical protein
MSNVPRLHWSADPNEPGMYEDPDGDYVHYEDYQASEQQNAALLDDLSALQKEWAEYRWSGYVPPEDGAAGEYDELATRACAEELAVLLAKHRTESAEGSDR